MELGGLVIIELATCDALTTSVVLCPPGRGESEALERFSQSSTPLQSTIEKGPSRKRTPKNIERRVLKLLLSSKF